MIVRSLFPYALLLLLSVSASAKIFLPGTQPELTKIEFGKVDQCRMCHSGTKNGKADPFFSWQGGMMAQAARDPVFRATVTVANQDIPGVGEFCFRCHTPKAWLEGRSEPADGSALTRDDLHGVSCDACHHLVDPVSQEAAQLVKDVPPGYGNAMMVGDPENVVRGPYGDGTGAMPHRTMKSAFHASSQLCGTCHDVSNPTLAEDVKAQPPHAFGTIERTYSEWALSDFAKRGEDGSCQSCHYPAVEGGGQASRYGDLHREHFVMHGPVGGSTWVQDATWLLWDGTDMDREALNFSKERARGLLRTAASLDVRFPEEGRAMLRVTNLTGHKLPTGFPEGRRMWVHVRFLDASGKLIEEQGRYGVTEDTLKGEAVSVPTLLDPEGTRVYECLPGISEEQARKYGKEAGKSLHFALNDMIVKDNRIPPKGFANAAFKEHLCEPVGAEYADGQHWDELELSMPQDCRRIEVRLMYQSVSWEYIKFLVEQNRTDDWGDRLYEAWTQTGRCEPTVIAEVGVAVPASR